MEKGRQRSAVIFSFLTCFAVGWSLEAGFELAGKSSYVWRGLRLSRGIVAQPSVWTSFAGWTFSPWANFSLGQSGDGWGLSELDIAVDYQREFWGITVQPSAAGYFYDGEWSKPEAELGLNCAYWIGEVGLKTGHNIGVFPSIGNYFGTIGVSFSQELGYGLTPEISLAAGWGDAKFNQVNYGVKEWRLNVVESELGLNYSLNGLVEVRPFLELIVVPDRTLRDAGGVDLIQVVIGLTFGKGL
ncbi:MAG: hypothetical protein ACUVUD_00135 [bacterium]